MAMSAGLGARRWSSIGRMSVLLALVAVGAGCASAGRPADAVALSIYTRNLSDRAFAFAVIGSHAPAILGQTGGREPRSYGCGWVGRDWQLVVTEGIEPPQPADDFAATASAAEYPQDAVALWIEVAPDGGVTIGEGVPAWWRHELQRCT